MNPQESQNDRWFQAVVARYEGPLLRYAARLVGDVELGRDVVQDTLLQLCRKDRAAVDGHLAEWLFTVCRHRSLDVLRKEIHMTTLTAERAAAQESRELQLTAAAEQRETSQQVQQLLSELTQNQQEVVRLKFQVGLSYREISRITGLSVSNVGYLIHTAIQKLRQRLNIHCP